MSLELKIPNLVFNNKIVNLNSAIIYKWYPTKCVKFATTICISLAVHKFFKAGYILMRKVNSRWP